ncbi:MAG: sulfatase-like hydrolase/transferase [Planctomycetes bacterium]|nr:sulfatase-like hydrolase/transferase [Planctomycetota bacterium]
MLLSDDLGYKDIGCYGGPVKTAALDKLAEGGVRFTDFYSGCAVCSPSRATLLTGRHHIRTGVYSWIHNSTQKSHLMKREVTIAEVLKSQGYQTGHFGKWHLGLPTDQRKKPTPADHGFDYWFATDNNASPSHHNPRNFIRNGSPVGELEGYSCQLVVDEAMGWLDKNYDKSKGPFFLNVWFHEPHAPIAAPKEISDLYQGDKKAKVYSGTIDNTDRAITRLVKKLSSVAPVEDTIIIYASDNGSYRSDRVGNLKGKKGVNWDGGIRVPGIFYWPGKIQKGRIVDAPAGLVDVLPTLCSILDIPNPVGKHIDGSNLKPILFGNDSDFKRHQPLFWHLQKSRPIVAMRDGQYSLVAQPDYELSRHNLFKEEWIPTIKKGGYKNFELFDLKKDPGQKNNIANANPEIVETLKKKLLSINKSIMSEGVDWHLPKQ